MWAIVCIYQMYDLPVCMCVFMLAVLNAPDYAEVIKKAYNCITADTVMRAKIWLAKYTWHIVKQIKW